ncbi:unnamed protein product [Periconia digitata]|uniref:Uncharacterized protein n=1 Tax=Periconia digitata TaxID=1303443 RepID=A0A9W4XWI8_9PLEO|nr:unnamed protein product [Periconia digitata]
MAGSTPSSITRYRPAILVTTGAAAAYIVWLLLNNLTQPAAGSQTADSLHRSNAVRRTPRRSRNPSRASDTARVVQLLQQDTIPLGHFDFFGHDVELDGRTIVSPEQLREVAATLQPTASQEIVDGHIDQLFHTLYDRLLGHVYPSHPLSDTDTEALTSLMGGQLPHPEALRLAMHRHRSRFELATLPTMDAHETIAPPPDSFSSYEETEAGLDFEEQNLQRTLYHIAEDRARHEGVIHRGIACNGCDAKPIRGIRWRCANCPDYDLCSDCEATGSHFKTHIFYKIRVPAPYMTLPSQESVYPGRPHLMNHSVDSQVKRRLIDQTRMEVEEIEALWDQFTCLAATLWDSDPNNIGCAMDRRAFDHAFIPRYSCFVSAPNLVYDRIFAYFDTDRNGLIGFEEFIKGLDGLHSSDSRIKLRIAFNGYDINGDGYISRKDVLRVFRALYAIERESARNFVTEAAEDLVVHGASETIRSSQPLGSAFTRGTWPDEPRPNRNLARKDPNAAYLDPITDDIPDTIAREDVIGDALTYRWPRRQFYIDEEEGLTPPAESPSNQMEDNTNGVDQSATDSGRRRESRSSSRVRFQDDVDFETRSNASTSSRPIGERWGGYEIPEPEKDLGKDVLYSTTQQALNELLDPLFRTKEDDATEAVSTRAERRLHVAEIEDLCQRFETERPNNILLLRMGAFTYAQLVMQCLCMETKVSDLLESSSAITHDSVRDQIKEACRRAEQHVLENGHMSEGTVNDPTHHDLWYAKLCRAQLLHEATTALMTVLSDRIPAAPVPDPTMPQFRPQSSQNVGKSNAAISSNSSQRSKLHEPNWVVSTPTFVVVHDKPGSSPQDSQQSYAFNVDGTSSSPTPLASSSSSSQPTTPPPEPLPSTPGVVDIRDPISAVSLREISTSNTTIDTKLQCVIRHHILPNAGTFLLERMRIDATLNPANPMHMARLASLEMMDREMADRNGGGLLDFEEFMKGVSTERLRVLEGWMDLVSF